MIQKILCADIGGTNARFAYYHLEHGALTLCTQCQYPTADFTTTEHVVQAAACTGLTMAKADICILGIAGPVASSNEAIPLKASLTNAALDVDFTEYDWAKRPRHLCLVNDFALQAWATLAEAVPVLPLLGVNNRVRANRGIVGAGTGLGTGMLLPLQHLQWHMVHAEGGHTQMAFCGEEEWDFVHFAQKFTQKICLCAEDILSARGISLLHAYVCGETLPPKDAIALWEHHGDTSKQMQLYTRFLGRFCRHWALNTLCSGGLYLGGGVLMKNPHIVQSPNFTEEFYLGPAPMRHILQNIPVLLMMHEDAGLWGAAEFAKRQLMAQENVT